MWFPLLSHSPCIEGETERQTDRQTFYFKEKERNRNWWAPSSFFLPFMIFLACLLISSAVISTSHCSFTRILGTPWEPASLSFPLISLLLSKALSPSLVSLPLTSEVLLRLHFLTYSQLLSAPPPTSDLISLSQFLSFGQYIVVSSLMFHILCDYFAHTG